MGKVENYLIIMWCYLFIYDDMTSVNIKSSRLRLKCDGTRAETTFRLSAKRTSPFKSVGASVRSTTGSRGVRFSGSNAGYTMFRGSVKGTGYPLHSPVSPSLPLLCVVCCHISTGLYSNMYGNKTLQAVLTEHKQRLRRWQAVLYPSYNWELWFHQTAYTLHSAKITTVLCAFTW
jgi:hypothetical protein